MVVWICLFGIPGLVCFNLLVVGFCGWLLGCFLIVLLWNFGFAAMIAAFRFGWVG